MKNPLKILVVENDAKHREDMNRVLRSECSRLPIDVDLLIARDMNVALQLVEQADGVMMADCFPKRTDAASTAHAMSLAEHCLSGRKPAVMVSLERAHQHANHRSISRWCEARGIGMFDCPSAGAIERVYKPWKEALYGLLYAIVALETGTHEIEDGRIVLAASRLPDPVHVTRIDPFITPIEDAGMWTPTPVYSRMLKLGFRPA